MFARRATSYLESYLECFVFMSWHKGAFDLSLMTFGKTDDAKILLLAIGLLSDVL